MSGVLRHTGERFSSAPVSSLTPLSDNATIRWMVAIWFQDLVAMETKPTCSVSFFVFVFFVLFFVMKCWNREKAETSDDMFQYIE